MRIQILPLIIIFSLGGCSSTAVYTDKEMQVYDKNTKYNVEHRENGFSLNIFYSKYQFMPNSGPIQIECKQLLTSLAWDYADEQKKKIKPLNEQRIKMSLGRNALTSHTSCSANAIVEWE